jgi:hypothetical protein
LSFLNWPSVLDSSNHETCKDKTIHLDKVLIILDSRSFEIKPFIWTKSWSFLIARVLK